MTTITLKLKEVLNPGPKEIHVYETPDGRTISFQSGEKSWTWHINTMCPILHKHREEIIDKYLNQGMKQHEYKGGWSEAISELKLFV